MLENLHLGTFASENARRFGEKVAFYNRNEKGEWLPITWREANEQVERMAMSFLAYGLKPGDKVGIYSQNMVEIIVVDLALQSIRCVSVPMYATQSAEQVDYIVKDADIHIIFTGEQFQFDETAKVIANNDAIRTVVGIDPSIDFGGMEQAVRYSDFIKLGDGNAELKAELEERQKQLNYEDLSILIYTSGTTGEPKGVIITAGNAHHALVIHRDRMGHLLEKGGVSMSFLPLSHIFERGWCYVCMMSQRDSRTFEGSPPKLYVCGSTFLGKGLFGSSRKVRGFPRFLAQVCLSCY